MRFIGFVCVNGTLVGSFIFDSGYDLKSRSADEGDHDDHNCPDQKQRNAEDQKKYDKQNNEKKAYHLKTSINGTFFIIAQ